MLPTRSLSGHNFTGHGDRRRSSCDRKINLFTKVSPLAATQKAGKSPVIKIYLRAV